MPNGNDDRDHQNNRQAEKENMLKNVYNFFFLNKSAVWTAIFTGVLTFFTYKLYQVSDMTSETSRSSERAFASFSNLSIGPRFTDPKTGDWVSQEVAIIWSNSGTTPAKSVVIQSNVKPQLEDLPNGYEFPLLPAKSEGTMGLRAPIRSTFKFRNRH
jgi:hypothetical protein